MTLPAIAVREILENPAGASAIAAWVFGGLSLVGYALIFWQLLLTRRSANAARMAADAAHAETRPWLRLALIGDATLTWPTPEHGLDRFLMEFQVQLVNLGRTPAQNVRLITFTIPEDKNQGSAPVEYALAKIKADRILNPEISSVIYQGEEAVWNHGLSFADIKESGRTLAVCVTYTGADNRQFHQTVATVYTMARQPLLPTSGPVTLTFQSLPLGIPTT